jgi:hypothetical protein
MIKPSETHQTKYLTVIPFPLDLGLFAVLLAGFYFLPLPQFLPCAYPLAEKAVLALYGSMLILFLPLKRYRLTTRILIAGINIGLSLLILWLGVYPISPLGFSYGRIPIVQGFVLTQSMRPDAHIASGQTINVIGGAAIAFHVVTLPVAKNCSWVSTKGGSVDDPTNCDIAYMPPTNSDFDLLKVLIQPACQLPEVQENIKIVVLP